MNTGRLKKKECRLINLWVPASIFPILDQAVRITDTDRSKFIRSAIREKIDQVNAGSVKIRRGVVIPSAAVAIAVAAAALLWTAEAPTTEQSDPALDFPFLAGGVD